MICKSRNIFHYKSLIVGISFILIISLFLFADTHDQLGDVNNDGQIDVLDIVRIVNIIMENDPPPTEAELWASDVNADETTNIQDIVIIVQVIMETDDCPDLYSPCSDNLSLCCMDTTSHNFTWEIDTLGNNGSYIYDVEIVSEDDIWVVGEFETDSGAYNGAKWNGEDWIFMGFYSNTAELYSIKYFDIDDIWVTSHCFPLHWNGQEWTLYHLQNMGLDACAGNGIWGPSSSNLYFVGYQGSIVHYDGENFEQMESGTDIDLKYISGTPDGEYVFTSGNNIVGGARSIVLGYEDSVWDTIYYSEDYLPDSNSEGMAFGNYTFEDSVYIMRKGGLWKYNYLTGNSNIVPSDEFEVESHDYMNIYVENNNDIFVRELFNILHYNGQSWSNDSYLYDYLGGANGGLNGTDKFDYKNGLLVVAGCYNCSYGRGIVAFGRRE